MQIAGTSFTHFGISFKKFPSHSASLPHFSNAMNSYSIIDLAIIVYLDDFHETTTPASLNT